MFRKSISALLITMLLTICLVPAALAVAPLDMIAKSKAISDFRNMYNHMISSTKTMTDSEIDAILEASPNQDPTYLAGYREVLEQKYSAERRSKSCPLSDAEIIEMLDSLEAEKAAHEAQIMREQDVSEMPIIASIGTGNGVGYSTYDRLNTLSYMDAYWNIYNPAYTNWYPQDCCNFGSQIMYAGGVPKTTTWFPDSGAWINNGDFAAYFSPRVYQTIQVSGYDLLRNRDYYYGLLNPGDIIQIGGNNPWHMYSVHDFADGDVKMAAHCDNYLHRSLTFVANAYPSEMYNLYLVKSGY